MSEEKTTKKTKRIVSEILSEPRQWIDARVSKPAPGQHVVMRLMNPTVIYAETETEIYPSENAAIGQYVQDYNDPTKGEWHIDPPFPLYDYTPISNKDRLKEHTVVTHWAVPADGELEGWASRFDQINIFQKLNIEVDAEHEEDVYRALLFGAGYMSKFGKNEPEMQYLATILYDLQYVMDTHKPILLTEEEYLAKLKEKAEKEAEEEAARSNKSGTSDEPVDKEDE